MDNWKYEIKKVYKTGGRAAVQVRFSCCENFFYKTFPCDSTGQLESIDMMCQDEIARVTELYRKIDELNNCSETSTAASHSIT